MNRSNRVLTQKARAEKDAAPSYDSLPEDMKAQMSRHEYENQQYRDSDEEEEEPMKGKGKGADDDGGLLPV